MQGQAESRGAAAALRLVDNALPTQEAAIQLNTHMHTLVYMYTLMHTQRITLNVYADGEEP